MSRPIVVLVALICLALAVPAPDAQSAPEGIRVVEAWPGLTFEHPIGVTHAPDGTSTVYVTEQAGRILAVTPGSPATKRLFLDLTAKVCGKGQGGLLGLAFHPKYAENGRFYVTYLQETGLEGAEFKVVLSEFTARSGVPDPASERPLLEIPKSTVHHNGGGLLFAGDGTLYMSTGDNKIQKEAVQTSQNPASLLGKILRIDVDSRSPGLPYGIPADNPWAAAGPSVRGEIWAYGLRNPWRFSFGPDGTLWTCEPGTKGAECRESVLHVQRGGNHGWPFFEGTKPLEPIPEGLRGATFVKPIYEYKRPDPDGISAAHGGFVYRGARAPSLKGLYLFADYGLNAVWALERTGGGYVLHPVGAVTTVSALGEDASGEAYACSRDDGKVYTFTSS